MKTRTSLIAFALLAFVLFQSCSDESAEAKLPTGASDLVSPAAGSTNGQTDNVAWVIAKLSGHEFPDEDYRSLDQASDLILTLMSYDDGPSMHLARILRPYPTTTQVEWSEVAEAVLSGKVVGGMAPHPGNVSVWTIDGRELTAQAPNVGALSKLCREVDPKGVFIDLMIE